MENILKISLSDGRHCFSKVLRAEFSNLNQYLSVFLITFDVRGKWPSSDQVAKFEVNFPTSRICLNIWFSTVRIRFIFIVTSF